MGEPGSIDTMRSTNGTLVGCKCPLNEPESASVIQVATTMSVNVTPHSRSKTRCRLI
jgi:hypothetical protein